MTDWFHENICPAEREKEFYCDTTSGGFWALWAGAPALIVLIFLIAVIIYWKKGK